MVQTTPLRVPCVELSQLTSSIPNGVTRRELALGQRKNCLSTLCSSGIIWNSGTAVLRAISGTALAKAFLSSSLLPASFSPFHASSLSPSLPSSLPPPFAVSPPSLPLSSFLAVLPSLIPGTLEVLCSPSFYFFIKLNSFRAAVPFSGHTT